MSLPINQLPWKQPSVWLPDSVEEALKLKQRWGDQAVLVAGGTWLRPRWENGLSPLPEHLISLERIPALGALTVEGGGELRIGAACGLAALQRHPLLQLKGRLLVRACADIAAPSVRHLATLGGNVMTRTGDLLPALLVMDAHVSSTDGSAEGTWPLAEWLKRGPSPQELLTAIVIPPAGEPDGFYVKVGRREAFTPSVVTVAGKLALHSDGTIAALALAAGGGAAVPARFEELEAAAVGQPLTKALLRWLHTGVMEQYQAVADDYAGVAYRKQTAANLIISELYKAWRQGGGIDAIKP
ncbi:FAD binding domain-containing protein [Paenibacillus aestuarii]|uniref:FAD binding domain-containing protein n=1 Tax=Paenibacillus aestuarii TaxID=516965 RepID=A0ABW0KHJ2_9BACL|nr:FAD binding domain-containing protein [Paenibacillus aestuarii]